MHIRLLSLVLTGSVFGSHSVLLFSALTSRSTVESAWLVLYIPAAFPYLTYFALRARGAQWTQALLLAVLSLLVHVPLMLVCLSRTMPGEVEVGVFTWLALLYFPTALAGMSSRPLQWPPLPAAKHTR